MSVIASLFTLKSFLVVSGFGLGSFLLNHFMGTRNTIVGAFTEPVMRNIKLVVYALAMIGVCLVLWKLNSIVEENKDLAVNNAVQQVAIDSMKEADKVEKSVDVINQKKTVEVIEAERKIETTHSKILENSTKREKLIETTLTGNAKQEALSAERISTLWEVYNSGMTPTTISQLEESENTDA